MWRTRLNFHIITITSKVSRKRTEKEKISTEQEEENVFLMSGVRGQSGQTGWRP